MAKLRKVATMARKVQKSLLKLLSMTYAAVRCLSTTWPSFQKFRPDILDVDYRDFFAWAREKLDEWKGIYEGPMRH